MELTKFFDKYNLSARVYPVLLLLLPSVITILAFCPEYLNSNPVGIVISIAIFSGFLYLLANVSRSTGKNLEKKLLKSWGGWPTTVLLRHRDLGLSSITKLRYHYYLSTQVPNLGGLPTELEEQQDSDTSDKVYDSAIQWLKEKRRDEKLYPILINEVTEYGFRRNLASLRTVGIIIYLGGLILCVIAIKVKYPELFDKQPFSFTAWLAVVSSPNLMGAALLNLLALCCTLLLTDDWVKEAAKNYAYSLLSTCDT